MNNQEDDPMFMAAIKKQETPPKLMYPLTDEETQLYAELFFKHLNANPENNIEQELIATITLE